MPNNQPAMPIVPIELGGKWIAWTLDGSRIVAHGDTLAECEAVAKQICDADLRFEKAPRADVRFIGAAR